MLYENKSICAIPFVSIMVNTDTTIRYCCMVKGSYNKIKKPNGVSTYTAKDNFIHGAWNSSDMRNIRKAMLKGEKIEGCSVCYLQEESNRKSNRQHSLDEWSQRLGMDALESKFTQAEKNDGIIFDDPIYLDLRLGNLCNLKCRMCNPWNSSQIAKEHIQLQEKNIEYKEVWKKIFGTFPVSVMDDQQWFESDILWDQVISLIPHLKKVYMTGGEPTLIKNNFKFMEQCIEQNRSDILLFFNTNCTNVNKTFLELITQFKQVNINVSIDGINNVNDYIRFPSNWAQLNENIEKLARLPNVNLGITPTVQVYNVFDLVNILEYVDKLNTTYNRKIFVDFLINVHPHHLSVTILPNEIKQRVIYNLQLYLNNSKNLPFMTINSTQGIIGLLEKDRPIDWQEQRKILNVYTKSLDNERKQYYNFLQKELVDFINEQY